MRSELEAALPQMKAAAMALAGPEGVMAVIGRRFVLFPQPKRTDDEWNAWWADYHAVLAEQPLETLEAAMSAWIAKPDSEFLPKPGELLALAKNAPTQKLALCARGYRALAYSMPKPAAYDPPAPPKLRPMAAAAPPVQPAKSEADRLAMAAKLRAMADAEDAKRGEVEVL